MDEKLLFYAEYLPRISSVVISIQPESPPKGLVLSSPSELQLLLQDQSQTVLQLPHQVYHPYNKIDRALLKYDLETGCYSLRLKCSDKIEEINSRSSNYFMSFNEHYRWNAKYLNTILKNQNSFTLDCSECLHTIVDSEEINKISELPSEIWIELMDFWHCHRPHEGTNVSQDNVANKFSILKPSKHSINVGVYYFSLNNGDIFNENLKIAEDSINFENNTISIQCKNCDNFLGESDFKTNLIKLNKWNLKLSVNQKGTSLPLEIFHPYSFAYSLIIDSINSSASRVFQITNLHRTYSKNFQINDDSIPDYLYIWVFNSGIDASTKNHPNLKDCLKIYYSADWSAFESQRKIINKEDFKSGIESETIELQSDILKNLMDTLTIINNDLPKNCQTMGKWKLGLLPFLWDYN